MPEGRCQTCRHFKHIEPGWTDMPVCLHPQLKPRGFEGWEVPGFDFGCLKWTPMVDLNFSGGQDG